MMKGTIITRIFTFIVAALFSAAVSAAGETEFIVQKTFTTVTPIFMSGHEGDMNWVEGFTFGGEITLAGEPMGTVSGEVRLANPPMNFVDVYDQLSMKIVNTIEGLGSFEVFARGVAMSSSTTPTGGDITVAWAGSIANGSGELATITGLSSGTGVANVFAGTASATEVVRIRFGF